MFLVTIETSLLLHVVQYYFYRSSVRILILKTTKMRHKNRDSPETLACTVSRGE